MSDISLIFPRSKFLIHEDVFPPLGILYLAAELKHHGYSVQCLDFGLGHTIDDIDSDIVGISFTTPQRFEAYELVSQLRQKNKLVIAGGAHATHMPSECHLNGFHCVVRGEAENVIGTVLSDCLKKDYKWKYDSEEKDMNDILFPDRTVLDIHKYNYKINDVPATVIMTSRSCPYSCSFCSKISNKYREQSASRTIAEIYQLNLIFGFSAFMIFDDVFIANKKRLEEIVSKLKYEKFLFRCFGRANLLTKPVCSLLSEMGVVEVGIGVESGSSTILKQNMKGTTRDVNTEAIKNLRQYGIRSKAFLIVGLPGETEETVKETIQWIEQAKPDDIDVSILQPMPGSSIFNYPEQFCINYDYNSVMWYKGKPDDYHSSSRTMGLSSERIVELRNQIENDYKRKELLR